MSRIKNVSLIVCFLAAFLFTATRFYYPRYEQKFNLTTWDALGYYFYLPSTFIYHDVSTLDWFPPLDSTYHLTGGKLYQANPQPTDGRYVFKYLGGVAVLQIPFFAVGHLIALNTDYPADGFSAPYQYALGFGILIYVILSFFLLRKILLRFFDDLTTSLTLVGVLLASNFIQYVSVDSAMSHAYIFPLYVLQLYATIKWHEKPKAKWAFLSGYLIGLAMISRPTEALMLLIPVFWNTQNKEAASQKWAVVKQNKPHIAIAAIAGLVGILPQLIYWKVATGGWVYDVGSKWDFLTPHWQVLLGGEKGWIIYTPIALFFLWGMFHIGRFPFKKSVILFCLLNIYVIISWHDFRYGASYSCRALSQSYPVFALALAGFIDWFRQKKWWKWVEYPAIVYLTAVNLFQILQYNSTVLHYYDSNFKYYKAIYLDKNPTPLDMSLLDTDELIGNEKNYKKEEIFSLTSKTIAADSQGVCKIFESGLNSDKETWLKVEGDILTENKNDYAEIRAFLLSQDSTNLKAFRFYNPLTMYKGNDSYAFYRKVPKMFNHSNFSLELKTEVGKQFELRNLRIFKLTR
ncbi:MAG: glycosyltransferase family 39 protein [Flavobacteriales bacterium]|nr:glycosyltransferase family 39 protein [Flavobacteriales bacterium]